jgi:hypothetical protein
VIDGKPRQLTMEQQGALKALARQVVAQCEFRRSCADLSEALADVRTLRGLLPMCSHCKSIRNDQGYWRSVEHYISTQTGTNLSHGICPECLKLHHPKMYDQLSAEE